MITVSQNIPNHPQEQDNAPQSQLRAITQLAQKLWRLEQPTQLMPEAVSIIAEAFSYKSINIFLLKGNKSSNKKITLLASLWQNTVPSAEEQADFLEQILTTTNVVRQVFKTGHPQIGHLADYTAPPAMLNVAAELAAPIFKRDQIIGAIHLFSHTTNELDQQDLLIIETIAAQLAGVIENAQARIKLRRQAYGQQILQEINAALGSSLLTEKIPEQLARKITEALEAGACTISRWNEESRTLTAIAEHVRSHKDNPSRTWREINYPILITKDPIGQQTLQTMRPLATRTQKSRKSSLQSPTWTEYGWQSILAFPIQTRGQKLGLVEIYDRNPDRVFSLEDIQLGKALASQVAIALGQVELLWQTQQRLAEISVFYTLSQQIISMSTLKLDQVLVNIVDAMRQIVGCRACVIFLLDENKAYLEIKAASGLKEHWAKTARLAVGEGAAGQAVAQKQTIYIPDTYQDPSFIFFDQTVRSVIVVPLIFQDEVIGAINLDDTQPSAFGRIQERLLSIAANHAAIAIQNATLFSKVLSEEQRTRAIIQHMADGLMVLSQDGEITKVNPALGMMLGMHPAEIIGQNAHAEHLDPRLTAICAPTTVKSRTGVLSNEVTLPGSRPITLRIFSTTLTDNTGQITGEVRVVHDVTQERKLEQLKDDFISTVSHELRTPLFSIQGFVRLMLDEEVPDLETQREFLTIIERQTNQLTDLIANLLDVNKMSTNALSIDKKPLQIIDLLNQSLLKLQGFAHKRKVQLIGQIPSNLPLVSGDAQRLEQVMTNLVGNAIKFTPSGGKVTVRAQQDKQSIIISVADTGIGIASNEVDKIFSKFYQVEEHSTRSTEGSGLGLHISKQLIEKHNGKIWVKSQTGKGSIFFVQLPIADLSARK